MNQKENNKVFQLCNQAFQRFFETPGKLKQGQVISILHNFSDCMLDYHTEVTNEIKDVSGQITNWSCLNYSSSWRELHYHYVFFVSDF